MNKRLFIIAGLLTVTTIFQSCKERVVKGEGARSGLLLDSYSFNAIEVSVPLKAIITVQEGAKPSVKLNGYGNIVKLIKIKAENNTLSVSLPEGIDFDDNTKNETTLEITLPSLTSLSLDGAADADIHGNVSGKEFSFDMSGASKVVVDSINVDEFSADISGAGSLQINGGTTKSASYNISGAGIIKAFGLQTIETEADISGSGKSEVTAQQKLTADISGAGNIKFKGHPQLTQDISGVGVVTDAN